MLPTSVSFGLGKQYDHLLLNPFSLHTSLFSPLFNPPWHLLFFSQVSLAFTVFLNLLSHSVFSILLILYSYIQSSLAFTPFINPPPINLCNTATYRYVQFNYAILCTAPIRTVQLLPLFSTVQTD